jgi:hypothetical protein
MRVLAPEGMIERGDYTAPLKAPKDGGMNMGTQKVNASNVSGAPLTHSHACDC